MATKRLRKSSSRTRELENEESSGSDMDLDKELHPLGHYLNDREEMLNQVFKVIKGPKLKAMLTSGLRGLDIKELKALCLTQLQGMSKKRIKNVIAGREMDESSATDEDSDIDIEDEGMAGSLGDFILPTLLHKNSAASADEKLSTISDTPDSPFDNAAESEHEEEEDLQDVIAKATSDLAKMQKKVDIKVGKKKPIKEKKSCPDDLEEDSQKLRELLELEMRARAIKSLLSRTKTEESSGAAVEIELQKQVPLIKEVQDPEVERQQLDEQKKLHKAREALAISVSKKRKEEMETERQKDEAKRRMEEIEAKKKAEEEEEKKKKQKELEKARRKAEREAEYQKYLKWKDEKKKREEEAVLKEAIEQEYKTKESLKRKREEIESKEETAKHEREKFVQETSLKKKKIERESILDELDRTFEVTFDYGESEEEQKEEKVEKPRRKYRKKIEGADDEDDIEERNASPLSSSRSETSLSLSEEEEDANIEKIRQTRLERLREIKKSKRKLKSEKDIEDGEVDSEGEHYVPVKENSDEIPLDNKDLDCMGNAPTKEPEDEKSAAEDHEVLKKDADRDNQAKSMTAPRKQESDSFERPVKEQVQSEIDQMIEVTSVGVEQGFSFDEQISLKNSHEPEKECTDSEQINTETKDTKAEQDDRSIADSPDGSNLNVISDDNSREPLDSKKSAKKTWHRKQEPMKESEPDYVFKTKRQLVVEQEQAPDESFDAKEDLSREEETALRKEQERKQKQYELRLKRMQAFQARSGMQIHDVKQDETEQVEDENDAEEGSSSFYKSYYEEEERVKREAEAAQLKDAQQVNEITAVAEVPVVKQTFVEITGSEVNPCKDHEAAEKEGVAYWTKFCDASEENAPALSDKKGTTDLPSKSQVDAQQAEQETWADRWYQNKKVQKVVQHSKMFSKIRTNFKSKVKVDSPDQNIPTEFPGTSAKDLKAEALRRKANKNPTNTELPVVGSIDEFSKIAQTVDDVGDNSGGEDEDEEDEEEGDGLWSAIMGKK